LSFNLAYLEKRVLDWLFLYEALEDVHQDFFWQKCQFFTSLPCMDIPKTTLADISPVFCGTRGFKGCDK